LLWIKALHLIFMVTWFAGLFYLPRLFVYHAMCDDNISNERFKLMERKLFFGIATPGGILTLFFGFWLLRTVGWSVYSGSIWLSIKLICIFLLVVYHIYCGKLMIDFKHDSNVHSHIWYRWFNELPVFILVAIIILAVVKPF
jgi:protoporphyrinogen IX oxidase